MFNTEHNGLIFLFKLNSFSFLEVWNFYNYSSNNKPK